MVGQQRAQGAADAADGVPQFIIGGIVAPSPSGPDGMVVDDGAAVGLVQEHASHLGPRRIRHQPRPGGDDLNVPRWIFADFPIDLRHLSSGSKRRLLQLVEPLEDRMKAATSFKLNAGKRVGNYNLAKCRDITSQVDREVCDIMGLSHLQEELTLLYCQLVKTDFGTGDGDCE
jgi:hypothetical protein